MKHALPLLLAALLGLTACGETKQDRVASGAMIGAGSGLVVGAMVGAPAIGTVVGTGVGMAVGAATDQSTLNMGDPVWK